MTPGIDDLNLSDPEKRRISIRMALAEEGEDPDDYDIVFDPNAPAGYRLRKIDEDEQALRDREALADAEAFFTKALREFGVDRDDIASMDVVEKAEAFRAELRAHDPDPDVDDSNGGGSR